MKIIECPRDAMQGIEAFIPTEKKVNYINKLLEVGFDTIDFGSFVSPKAIPQMRDTHEVIRRLDLAHTDTKLLAIVANVRGASEAMEYDEIDYLGYPLSLSETFQQRNTRRAIDDAFSDLAEIQERCDQSHHTLVVYLSMGFGNPYGDPYEVSYVSEFVDRLDQLQVAVISLADTIGVAHPQHIQDLFGALIPAFPHIEFGAHLHSTPDTIEEKLHAVQASGCMRIDGAVRGFGGCPMAKDELVGNMATERIIHYLEASGQKLGIAQEKFDESVAMAIAEVFTHH